MELWWAGTKNPTKSAGLVQSGAALSWHCKNPTKSAALVQSGAAVSWHCKNPTKSAGLVQSGHHHHIIEM